MTPSQLIILFIIGFALLLFITEWLRPDVTALLVTLALLLTNQVTTEEAFAGFASPAVVTVWAVFILSAGLERAGVADRLIRFILRWSGEHEARLQLILMLVAGGMSALMNNIGAVAILMPVAIGLGRRMRIPSSHLLMPIAFASLLGGNITLIGTPPNILASDLLAQNGVEPFGFFDFAPTGFVALLLGVLYLYFIGRRLLPNRTPEGGLSYEYAMREYLAELRVLSGSPLEGRPLTDSAINEQFGLNVVQIMRGSDSTQISPLRTYRLEANDLLLVEGNPQAILDAQANLRLSPSQDWTEAEWTPDSDPDAFHLAEITLAPNSTLDMLSLEQIDFRQQYGLTVLAIRHNGKSTIQRLTEMPLHFGDSLLVQGPRSTFNNLLNDPDVLVLERPQIRLRRLNKAPLTVFILLAVIIVAAAGWLAVSTVMLAGALLMVVTAVLTMEEAYRAIDWKAVFLIAGMLPLGTAMQNSGAVDLLVDSLLVISGSAHPVLILGYLFAVTTLLTQVISNAAATVLLVPIAVALGQQLAVSPYPLVMAVVLAASSSFLLPVGHQVNVIIFGAGDYRTADYVRVGLGLNVIVFAIALLVIPIIWPF